MSLSISVHRPVDGLTSADLITHGFSGLSTDVPLPPGGDLGGFESWRETLYGSEESVRLGLTLLPSLRSEDLYAHGEALEKLKQEAKALSGQASVLAPRLAQDEETILRRLGNIVRACELAQSVDGVVWIS